MQLSDEQLKILNLNSGKHLVLAFPGTGKTELLSLRIIKALEDGVNQENMVCLTFTVRAAIGMKERIRRKGLKTDFFVGNIHQFCWKFLRQNKLVPINISILDEQDSYLILNDIINNMPDDKDKDKNKEDITDNDIKDVEKGEENQKIPEIGMYESNFLSKLLKYNTFTKQKHLKFSDMVIINLILYTGYHSFPDISFYLT